MTIKEHEYVRHTLERYTSCSLDEFNQFVIITNFKQYIERFEQRNGGTFSEGTFRVVHAGDLNCSMIDFGIGSPQAALVVNCLVCPDRLKLGRSREKTAQRMVIARLPQTSLPCSGTNSSAL